MRSVSVSEVPSGAQFIDVREADEYAAVHAENAVNLPMSNFTSHVDQVNKGQEVYVICKSGGRSAQVCQYLESAGYDAINVEGGTDAWVAAGLPTG